MSNKDKEIIEPQLWQRLITSRLAVPRILLAIFLVGSLLIFWDTQPRPEIQVPDQQQGWTQNSTEVQAEPVFQEPQRTAHTHGHINGLLPIAEAEAMCVNHNMKPYPNRDKHRKVYDLFLVGTELTWAEVRLNELQNEVDYFVILESAKTFTNKTKPTHFKNNWDRFSKFKSQIIYHLLDDSMIQNYGAWDREYFSRNALINQIFPSLIGEQEPQMGDVIIVSDIDEIPRAETVAKLRNCDIPKSVGMEAKFFLYSFTLHNLNDTWIHPQATTWQGLEKTPQPERLRIDKTDYDFPNAAWHCTTCFSTVSEFVNKVRSFSHQEYNKPEYTNPEEIVRRVRNGIDLFDRKIDYEHIPQESLDVPQYLLQNPHRFAYLMDRSPENANFRDYVPEFEGEYNPGIGS